jgi:hypothetical protein
MTRGGAAGPGRRPWWSGGVRHQEGLSRLIAAAEHALGRQRPLLKTYDGGGSTARSLPP